MCVCVCVCDISSLRVKRPTYTLIYSITGTSVLLNMDQLISLPPSM